MKVKVSELNGIALDWAVAKCEGIEVEIDRHPHDHNYKALFFEGDMPADFTFEWAWAGPIIEREKIGVWWATHYVDEDGVEYGNHWYAEVGCTDENADSRYCGVADGPTPLVAAMRCYVAMKMGNEVDVPDELMEGEVK